MKVYSFVLVSVLGAFLLSSCGNTEKISEEKNVQKEKLDSVFLTLKEKHDEVMPQIDEVMEMKSLIKEELQRIGEGLKTVSEERKKALENILNELEGADDSMMDWMREQYRKPADSIDFEEAIKWLEKSQESIDEVKENIDRSIQQAKELLEEVSEEE